MPRPAAVPTLLAAVFCCSAALAQDVSGFTELSACRIDADRILLRATFDGGACMEVQLAQLAEPRGTIVSVHLPTINTSEMCTMQIVPVETEQAIDAPADIANLEVTVGDPQNNEIARGAVDVADAAEDCVAPED